MQFINAPPSQGHKDPDAASYHSLSGSWQLIMGLFVCAAANKPIREALYPDIATSCSSAAGFPVSSTIKEVVLMGKSPKDMQVHIHSNTNTATTASESTEARTSTSDSSEGAIMSSNCESLTAKKTQCKNGGPRDIHHNDHRHHVCGQHMESESFVNCNTAEKLTKVEQPTLSLPNTDGLTAIQKLREEMKAKGQLVRVMTKEEAMEIMVKSEEKNSVPNVNPMKPNEKLPVQDRRWMVIFGERTVPTNSYVIDSAIEVVNRFKERFPDGGVADGGAKGGDYIGSLAAKATNMPLHMELPHVEYFSTYKPYAVENFARKVKYAESLRYTVSAKNKWHLSHNFKRNSVMAKMGTFFVCISFTDPAELKKATKGGTAHMLRECLVPKGVEKVWWINAKTGELSWIEL